MILTIDQQLFLNVAKHIGLRVDVHENGNGTVVISQLQQVEVNKALMRIISMQIENKLFLVEHYKKLIDTKQDFEKLAVSDEYFKQLRELLDLEVEYAAKDSYVAHHENYTPK